MPPESCLTVRQVFEHAARLIQHRLGLRPACAAFFDRSFCPRQLRPESLNVGVVAFLVGHGIALVQIRNPFVVAAILLFPGLGGGVFSAGTLQIGIGPLHLPTIRPDTSAAMVI
jgi:hypothetical protein